MALLVHKWSVCRKKGFELMNIFVYTFCIENSWIVVSVNLFIRRCGCHFSSWCLGLECLFERFLLHMKLEQYVICFSILKLFLFFSAYFPREQLVLGWWGGVRRGGWRPTALAPIGTPRSLPTPLGGPRATGNIRRAGWSVLLRKRQEEQNINGNRRASASGF